MAKSNNGKTRSSGGPIDPPETETSETGPIEVEETRGQSGVETAPGPGGEPEVSSPENRAQVDTVKVKPVKPSTAKVQRWREKQKQVSQGADTAVILLSILDGLVTVALGPECRMNDRERAMLQEPLSRIVARAGWLAADKINQFSDPILLVMGLISWGTRIARLQAEKKQRADPPRMEPETTTDEPKPKPEPGNIDIGEATAAPAHISAMIGGL